MCFNLSPNEIELSIICCDSKFPILPAYFKQYSLSKLGDYLSLLYLFPCIDL